MKNEDLADIIGICLSIITVINCFDGPIEGQVFWVAIPLSAILFMGYKLIAHVLLNRLFPKHK